VLQEDNEELGSAPGNRKRHPLKRSPRSLVGESLLFKCYNEGPTYLRIIGCQLITCMPVGGDFIVYDVSVVRDDVRIPSNVDERRARDLYGGWSQGFLAGGPLHGCECPERQVEGPSLKIVSNY